MLQTLDSFNDGTENTYAFGVGIGDFKGVKSVGHGGAIGGFRANIVAYPEEKLSIAILTNFSNASPGQKSNAISAILLENVAEKEAVVSSSNNKIVKLSKNALAKYEGSYWNDKENYVRKIYLKDDTLRYYRSENNESPIVPIGRNEFQMFGVSADLKIKFETSGKHKTMSVSIDDGESSLFQNFEPEPNTKDKLSAYTGKFYSPELETTYAIYVENDTLYYHHARHGNAKMTVLKKDILEGQWPLRIAKYKRDEMGTITGILVSNGRVRNLWFEKLP